MSVLSQTGFVKKTKKSSILSGDSRIPIRRREVDNSSVVSSNINRKVSSAKSIRSHSGLTGGLKNQLKTKGSKKVDWCFYVDCTIEEFVNAGIVDDANLHQNNYLGNLYGIYHMINSLPLNNFIYVYCSKEPKNGITGKKLSSSVTVLGGCSLEIIKQKIQFNLVVLYNSLSFFYENYLKDKPIILWQTLEKINFLDGTIMNWADVKNLVNNFSRLHSVVVENSTLIHLGQNYKNYQVIPSGFKQIPETDEKYEEIVSVLVPEGDLHSPDIIETAVLGLSSSLGNIYVSILVNDLENNEYEGLLEKNNSTIKYRLNQNNMENLSKMINVAEYVIYCPSKERPNLSNVLSYLNAKKMILLEKSPITELTMINNVTQEVASSNNLDNWKTLGKHLLNLSKEDKMNLEVSSSIVADKFKWSRISNLWHGYISKKYVK